MKKNSDGFTLTTAVFVMILLGLGLPSLIIALNQATKDLALTEQTAIATMLGQDLMEEIKTKQWDHNATKLLPIEDYEKTGTLGPESGESRGGIGASGYNDIDDYNGLNNKPPKDASGTTLEEFSNYHTTVIVDYVRKGNFDSTDSSSPLPNFKRVILTVSWENDSKSISLTSIMGNI
ncbi:hypothetical protein ACFL1T_01860 [Chlamydiota bacterium]